MIIKKKLSEEEEIRHVERDIHRLEEKLIEKRPSHFRKRDVINALMSSFIFGLLFIFKGNILEVAIGLNDMHLVFIILSTIIILTLEIYFIGYTRVENKKARPFGQFWAKRFSTMYLMSLLISVFLIYIYNINNFIGGGFDIVRVVIAVSMPTAIGAAVPSLLKQY